MGQTLPKTESFLLDTEPSNCKQEGISKSWADGQGTRSKYYYQQCSANAAGL